MASSKGVKTIIVRYSFATHFLKNGVDLRYIQEILGYESLKMTEIYPHVSRKNLGKIVSPIDTINLNKGYGR
ncbi:tyrosine-type recombinase/integrase [bacterium]|nr:tyrosine-type recombinase/integrase [bacterium]